MLSLLFVALSVATYAIYRLLTKYHNCWAEKGIPHEKPNAIFGNYADRILIRKSSLEFDRDHYRKYPNAKVYGYYEFRNPVLWIRDPEVIRHVLVKDFDHFVDRRSFETHNKCFDEMVMNKKGDEWRKGRNIITPAYTSGKLKNTFGCMTRAAEQMTRFLEDKTSDPAVEIKDVFGRYTMEVIAATAFAVDSHCFRDSDAVFPRMAARMFSPSGWRSFAFLLSMVYPEFTRWIPCSLVDDEATDFFADIAKAAIAHRRKNVVEGNDFLQLLLNAQKEGGVTTNGRLVLTDDEVVANAVIFFAGGYETTATTLSFAAYELALNQDVQNKLLEEIRSVVAENNDEITYEAVNQMPYMDMVLSETLRKYPVATRLERECTENYKIPGMDVVIEKGMNVNCSIAGIHHDPRHYPDPERFDPERFSAEAKKSRHPYTYLPFGHGPRNCVGMRLALIEAKVAIAKLLLDFQLDICSKTEVPLTFDKSVAVLQAANGIWLQIEKRIPAA